MPQQSAPLHLGALLVHAVVSAQLSPHLLLNFFPPLCGIAGQGDGLCRVSPLLYMNAVQGTSACARGARHTGINIEKLEPFLVCTILKVNCIILSDSAQVVEHHRECRLTLKHSRGTCGSRGVESETCSSSDRTFPRQKSASRSGRNCTSTPLGL